MIVPHQSPSACQTELMGPSSGSTVAVYWRPLLVSVSFVRSDHYDGACRHCLIAPELFPFQATCALKRKVFPQFWLRDDIARKAAQMVGQVGTRTPLDLVCLAVRSSAGRRRVNEKRGGGSHLAWAATLIGCHKKTRVRASHFFSAGACGVMRTGGGVFSSPAWSGATKENTAAALFAGAGAPAKKKRTKKILTLSPQQHAPRRNNPAPLRPPSRSHLRLS